MARDKKEHAEDLDGWRKNVQKIGDEYGKVKEAVKNSGDSHDPFTNTAVEVTRASPYFVGHLLVVIIVAAAIAGGVILYVNLN